jgi:hypothetical protein
VRASARAERYFRIVFAGDRHRTNPLEIGAQWMRREMSSSSETAMAAPDPRHGINISWLLTLRWGALAGQLVTILAVDQLMGIGLPLGLIQGISFDESARIIDGQRSAPAGEFIDNLSTATRPRPRKHLTFIRSAGANIRRIMEVA